jgi:hypothetical protein
LTTTYAKIFEREWNLDELSLKNFFEAALEEKKPVQYSLGFSLKVMRSLY